MNNKLTLELVWWLITLVVSVLVILPIYLSIGGDYLFYIENVVSVIVLITLARWILTLRHNFFSHNKKVKLVLIFAMIPLFFICYDNLIDFQAFADEYDLNTMLGKLDSNGQVSMAKYIKYEYIFFGTGAIMCTVFIPFRMVISLWRQINKGTV